MRGVDGGDAMEESHGCQTIAARLSWEEDRERQTAAARIGLIPNSIYRGSSVFTPRLTPVYLET